MQLSKQLLLFFTMISLGLQAQNIGIKIADGTAPNTTLDVNGAVSFREGTALTLTNGVNSDIALTEYSFFRITGPTAAFSITGFAGGNDGRMLTIMNNTSQVMTLTHQATSTSANQINTGGTNTTIAANGMATLYYSSNLSKWIVTAVTGATPIFTTINTGTYTDSMIVINNGIPGRVPPREYIENYSWGLDGNTGTTAGTHFLGTTDAQAMVIKTNNTERARISSAGYVGINNTMPTYRLHIEDPSGSDADILSRVYNNGVITGIPGLLLQTASGTKAAPISMPSGGQLGVIRWGGYDGSAFNDTWCAEIAAMATQNWTTSAHGTGMWFRTIQNDSTLSRARMVITHNGFVGLGFDSYTPQYKLDIDGISGGTGNPLRLLGLNAGATSDSIISSSAGILRRLSVNQVIANAWNITGNSGTVDGTNYIGTSDNIPLSIRVNNQKAGRIDQILNNAFWGYQAGNAMSTGTNNVAMGSTALSTMTTGAENVAIGGQSGLSNTTGVRNVSIGYQSARNGTHSNSVMIGYQAGLQNAASNNVFIGSLSGPQTSTGSDNIGLGYYTLFQNQTGKNNIGIGSFALSTTTAAWGNTAIGHMSSTSIQTGQANTALGDSSLMNNVLGSNNTHIGYRAGLWTTGSNNIAIGYNATLPVTTADNQLALGTWLYGTNSNLGINTTTPQYKLDIDAKTGSAGNPLRLQGLQAGVTSDSIISSNAGVLRRLSIDQIVGASGWGLTGNSGTNPSTNFIGTTDEQDLVFKTNYTEAMRIVNDSRYIGIGTASPFTVLSNHTGNIADFSGRGSNQNSTILWNSTGGAYGMIVNNADVTGTGSAIMAKINSTDQAAFGLMVNVAGTDAFVVNGSANVGINKGIPEYKLDIDAQTGSAGNPLRLLGLNAGSTGDSIISSSGGILRRLSIAQVVGSGAWSTLGNAGTVDGTNFIGTTDNIPFNIKVNNFKAGRIDHLNYNAFFGFMSGNSNSGTRNSFFGHQAGSTNTTGSYNTGLGYGAMGTNTTASNNVAIGAGSMESNTTGYDNVAIGRHSMRKNTTFYHNTAVGTYSLQENLGGYSNTAVGWSALNQTTTGNLNTATGAQALIYNITGSNNVASGFQSLYFNTAGNYNTAIGTYSMFKNSSGNHNAVLGSLALGENITGWGNTAIGHKALLTSVNGQSNVAVGDSALLTTVTSNNTGIGYASGATNTTGANNTFVGHTADATSSSLTNATAIGYSAKVGASNSLVLGGTGANAVNVGIGTTTPSGALEVKSTNALSTGVGVKFRSSTLDSVLTLGNDANFKFRNTTYDFGTDPNNFQSGHYLSSAGFRTFTPVYGRGFFGIESLLASGTTTAASNYYGFRSSFTEEAGHSTALNETYSGIFNFNKYGSGNYTFHQNLISNIILRSGSSGTFTNAQAVVGQLTMGAGSANVTTANLFQANLGDWASGYSGTISNLRGLYINYLGHARVQNAYGIFMEDVAGATSSNYAIYTKMGRVRFGDVPSASDADVVTIDGSGNLTKRNIYGVAWNQYGNSGTNPSSQFIGTTDAVDLAFRTNNTEQMRIKSSGNVGISTTSPNTSLDINGGLTTRPSSTVSLIGDNQAVTVGNSSFIILSSNNTTATNRTFTLSSGLQSGQVLTILLTTNNAELADSGNCALASTFSMNSNDTISLIWNGSTWYETSRSAN